MKVLRKMMLILFCMIAYIIAFGTITKATTVRITVDDLNLREKASSDSDVYTTLSKGEEYKLVSEEDEWYEIEYEDYTGYISKDYAEIVKTSDDNKDEDKTDTSSDKNNTDNNADDNTDDNTDTNKTDTTPNKDNENNENQSKVNTGKMTKNEKARILPLIHAKVLQTLKTGTNITIIEEINGWSYIATDKMSAWVRSDSIKLDNKSGENKPTDTTTGDDNKQPDNKNDDEEPDETNEKEESNTFTKKTMYVNDSYVNIRKEPSTSSEVLFVVALNTELTVIGEEGDWYKVDTSKGEAYISKELLSEEEISTTSRGGTIVRGATENIATEDLSDQKEEATVKKEEITNQSSSEKGEEIVEYAKKFLGVPYVYGGASPSGFDCSGFTMYVFDKFGIDMAHGAQNQAELGKAIKTDKSSSSSLKNNLQPGDLVFFLDYETMDEIGHCGIYIGDGNFIHASSGTGYCVKIDSLLPGEYYNTRYCAARRVI